MDISRRNLIHGLLTSPVLLTRAEAQVTPEMFAYQPEIEPLVALIERTPRERCAEMAVEQLRAGTTYRELMAALFLAGIRNVNPRPPGFAMHCVFVIHAAHLLGMEAPADSRLLPLFYALDNFKTAQDRDAKAQTGDYTMGPLRGALPGPDRAAQEFVAGMEAWDMERAERAVAALARYRGAAEVFEMLWRYGARDYRNIGHKAIYVANAFRTLETIGWQYAEPVLRSVTLALLDFGLKQQVNGYGFDDQCYLGNLKRVKESFSRLPANWNDARGSAADARGILESIRQATPDEACMAVTARLVKGQATAGSVWDAVHLAAGELRLRARPPAALVSIHSVTSANGLHHGYLAATAPETRFLLLLQGVGWMTQFRTAAGAREGALREFPITQLEPAAKAVPLEETLGTLKKDPDGAASQVMRMAREAGARNAFLRAAVRLTAAKVDEVHYYKYLASLIEDIPLMSPEYQPHMTAVTAYYMKGSGDGEAAPMKRAREALRGLAG